MKAFLCHGFGLSSASYWAQRKSHDSSSICASLQVVKSTTMQRLSVSVTGDKNWWNRKNVLFISFASIFMSGTLNKKWLLPPRKMLKEVKIGYINIVGLFVVAPQFIQPSVAIETGLVFLSALQLEEKKKSSKYSWVCLAVCISMCVRACTLTHSALIYPFISL